MNKSGMSTEMGEHVRNKFQQHTLSTCIAMKASWEWRENYKTGGRGGEGIWLSGSVKRMSSM